MKFYLEAQHIKHIKETLFLLTWRVEVQPEVLTTESPLRTTFQVQAFDSRLKTKDLSHDANT